MYWFNEYLVLILLSGMSFTNANIKVIPINLKFDVNARSSKQMYDIGNFDKNSISSKNIQHQCFNNISFAF